MTDDSEKVEMFPPFCVFISADEMGVIRVAIGFGIPLSLILTLRKLFKKHCIPCRLLQKDNQTE